MDNFKKFSSIDINMTTFVLCDKCGKKFRSGIQIGNLETNPARDNPQPCPHCGEIILTGTNNMINE